MALAWHGCCGYFAAIAIKIKAPCDFYSWISATNPSEIN
jgi:hypothetical protein